MYTSRPYASIVSNTRRDGQQVCRSAIEVLFPRIARELTQHWFRTGIDDLLGHLILDDRSGRHGFPLEVIEELMFLADIRWHLTHDHKPEALAHTADMEFLDYDPPGDNGLVWHSRVIPALEEFAAKSSRGKTLN